MKEIEPKISDKIEIVKQQQRKQTLVLQKKIIPKPNHLLFEYNTVTEVLGVAEYEPHRKEIHWHEAIEISKHIRNPININCTSTITKEKVINKPNCIYISALNKDNAIKLLEREYQITLKISTK
mgnify:FL=1